MSPSDPGYVEYPALVPVPKRLVVRAASVKDFAAALALVDWEKQKNPWIERVPDLLLDAVRAPGGEYRACVAERDSEIIGFGAYGIVAGTRGTGFIHSILVAPRSRRAGVGARILLHIAGDLAAAGARIIVAEIPSDPRVVRFRALLISFGFMEESRIEDYYGDGLPQIVSRLDLSDIAHHTPTGEHAS